MALLTYGVLTQGPNEGIDQSLADQRPTAAPAFELPILLRGSPGARLSGVERRLSDGTGTPADVRGVPVVLNFWASWCVPCREEAPLLERTWRAERPRGTLFLGLNMQDLSEDALDFLRGFRVTYPNVRDKTNATARRWGVTGLPETFFIAADGRIVGHVIGVVSAEQLRDGIAAARAGRVLGALDGGARRPTQ